MIESHDDGPDYKLLKSDPQKFLALVQEQIRQNPGDEPDLPTQTEQ